MPAVTVNGERVELAAPATAADAVRAGGVEDAARGVAVAVDGEVVPRAQWSAVALTDGTQVEILHAVQGG